MQIFSNWEYTWHSILWAGIFSVILAYVFGVPLFFAWINFGWVVIPTTVLVANTFVAVMFTALFPYFYYHFYKCQVMEEQYKGVAFGHAWAIHGTVIDEDRLNGDENEIHAYILKQRIRHAARFETRRGSKYVWIFKNDDDAVNVKMNLG